ncbi:hypothetical protein LSM04_007836 [Trypanosoma melophagium]|uniref:uncharacterized protein n=1 Tax=Trypanosoma melophagium TaxID=715481 RepID=UPI00351A691B|nr:hypothetical protein LSM04_007836 [Trypanosoma melophagium]
MAKGAPADRGVKKNPPAARASPIPERRPISFFWPLLRRFLDFRTPPANAARSGSRGLGGKHGFFVFFFFYSREISVRPEGVCRATPSGGIWRIRALDAGSRPQQCEAQPRKQANADSYSQGWSGALSFGFPRPAAPLGRSPAPAPVLRSKAAFS